MTRRKKTASPMPCCRCWSMNGSVQDTVATSTKSAAVHGIRRRLETNTNRLNSSMNLPKMKIRMGL